MIGYIIISLVFGVIIGGWLINSAYADEISNGYIKSKGKLYKVLESEIKIKESEDD